MSNLAVSFKGKLTQFTFLTESTEQLRYSKVPSLLTAGIQIAATVWDCISLPSIAEVTSGKEVWGLQPTANLYKCGVPMSRRKKNAAQKIS